MSWVHFLRGGVVFVSLLALAGALSGGGCAQPTPPPGGSGGAGGSAGGGGNGQRCTGTPRACAGLDDFDCVTTNGCAHTGVCQGTALDCASLSATGCVKQPGCMLQAGTCSGSPQQCFNLFNQAQCTQQKGCFWDAANFYCNGNPTSCSQIPAESCSTQLGCTPSQPTACFGAPTACDTLMDKDTCGKEIGCAWLSQCSGTPTACETFSDADCRYQPGCTCEGCETSSSSSTGGGPPCVNQSDCDPSVDPCKTGDCINGECIRVPNCKVCVKQIDCDPHTQPCLTGNCIDQKCQTVPNCQMCVDGSECSKAVNKCFSGSCTDGACDVITACGSGDGCCPSGCTFAADSDCP